VWALGHGEECFAGFVANICFEFHGYVSSAVQSRRLKLQEPNVPRLQELLAKKEALDKEIAETQRKERSAAIAHVRTLMSQYGLTVADVASGAAAPSATGKRRGRPPKAASASPAAAPAGARKRKSKLAGKKVPAKFKNKATGETWSGRGLKPRWLSAAIASGKKLADFAV
jgi:DNA-binding protein H-NS